MFPKISFLFAFIILQFFAAAQITTNPALPVATQKVTITFDSSKESKLGYYTGDLYAHTGVFIEGKAGWQHVIGSWGNNNTQPKLTNKGNGIYELEITPDINTFYSVLANEKVQKMAFVFRSADGTKQTNDLFVNVYAEGLVIDITQPANGTILTVNQTVTITASASENATLKLFAGEILLSQNSGTSISTTHSFGLAGQHWFIAEATTNSQIIRDSSKVFVRENTVTEPKPAAYRKGINYTSSTSVALVLWAPFKDNVFIIGDFNDWNLSNNYQMKKTAIISGWIFLAWNREKSMLFSILSMVK